MGEGTLMSNAAAGLSFARRFCGAGFASSVMLCLEKRAVIDFLRKPPVCRSAGGPGCAAELRVVGRWGRLEGVNRTADGFTAIRRI